MAEKRRLPPRDRRESAAKRRVSEAAPQSTKKKAPTPRAPSPLEFVDAPLPTNLKDVEGLPVLRARQPLTLSDKEYQSIAESAVLLAALERSKKKWLSDGILVRYFTKPKKTKREQIERNNPPKDSMTKVGPCDITIGPHFFDAMIYTVKDPNAPPSLQYASPQRPMVHYGHPNNFQQYRPYPSPSNPQRPNQYSPAPAGRPGYSGSHPPAQQPRGPNQSNAPSPQGGQRPQPGQKGPNGQPAKPSPDPVIQMLATRAAADPELKALMRVVASSQASQEQLRAFQAHIDELNAIIKSREQQEQRQQASATAQPQQTPTPQPQSTPQPQPQPKQDGAKPASKEQPATQTKSPAKLPPTQAGASHPPAASTEKPANPQNSAGTATIKQEPTAVPNKDSQATPTSSTASVNASTRAPVSTPGPQQTPTANLTSTPAGRPQSAARPGPGPPYPPYPQPAYGSQTPIQSRPPQYATPNSFYRSPVAPLAPPRVGYKSVVFEFTSPLTPYGNATSGHAGSGDRYLFPENTILEWLPDENTVIASFLVVRKVDANATFPLETPTEAANSKGKGKSASKSKKGEPKGKAEKGADPAGPQTPAQPGGTPHKQEPSDSPMPDASAAPINEANLKEYWQPVTFRIHSPSTTILEPLARVVKPADEVRKYMNEVMDRAERAPDGFLAMRLPREESHEPFDPEGTPASNVGTRSRLSRVQLADEESEVETSAFEFEEEDEDDLKDFYDAPYGLPPLKT
ncbi:uncharacterized protein N7511_009592 [Penicillium nucicola]|uniref:uncharacterized protein n=1 Tax=Penicillium nucicola TaxID=1850975 RepID=UPI002545424A|nr:uncharacterized protein N7511_009592 [Penicillium nucicola]KAJ5747896.1 hypothetical protein N7511_009592 [Penicillium nucicola]